MENNTEDTWLGSTIKALDDSDNYIPATYVGKEFKDLRYGITGKILKNLPKGVIWDHIPFFPDRGKGPRSIPPKDVYVQSRDKTKYFVKNG